MTKEESDHLVQQLAAVPLFAKLHPKDLKALSETAVVRSYTSGHRIVEKGKTGVGGFYLLLEGRVEVRGDGKVLATFGPGAFFGEMALFEEQPRTADVVAIEPSRCLELARWEFWGYMANRPEALRTLIEELVRRLRGTTRALTE